MIEMICTLAVWLFGGIGCCVMKKIEPENRLYPIYVLIVCVLFTCVVIMSIA